MNTDIMITAAAIIGWAGAAIYHVTAALKLRMKNAEWELIEKIRNDSEVTIVSIHSDNADFNNLPNSVITVTGYFTDWADRDYRGATVLVCLSQAYADMQRFNAARKEE